MLVFDFWRRSVVHLCVYVCAREGKEERRELKNDGVAFANHSPGVHYSSVVRESQTHARARSLSFLF